MLILLILFYYEKHIIEKMGPAHIVPSVYSELLYVNPVAFLGNNIFVNYI